VLVGFRVRRWSAFGVVVVVVAFFLVVSFLLPT
jgi:hypothetical protein